ncbi:MAG: fibronectin/fibrinogen-binding protein [Lachnospiraceae bacterium]|jgi:predicted ribosome quality control (RQC) complex YloA/Tae2 family protein|nr:fibronectin/fibrinogen-binding protein [Lachnospiraceae bacterium]
MAFDGITIANLVYELKNTIEGGKIAKIAQPEKDELLFTIKNLKQNYRLLVSASASLPLLYLTETNKPSPLTAPNFCMLLRKHIGNAKILSVSQPGLERIVELKLEHLDELGDLCCKRLIIELMGKHSNIIFCKEDGTILDSIKHISAQVSSVREVLPGREYFIPHTVSKQNPLELTEETFFEAVRSESMPLSKALYQKFTGISPIIGEELCHLASLDGDIPSNTLSDIEFVHLYHTFSRMMEDVQNGNFSPNIIYQGLFPDSPSFREEPAVSEENDSQIDWNEAAPVEFSALPLTCFSGSNYKARAFTSISTLLETYYSSKNTITRIRQKSSDLRRIVQTALERNYKKYDLQEKQLKDTEKRENYRIYGELLNTYGYELKGGEKKFTCLNYYTDKEITIPLDPMQTPLENAQRFFEKYNKLKRTYDALNELTMETRREIQHLESISNALDIALQEADLVQIKEELMEYGYIKKRHAGAKRPKIISKPFHYLSSDGFHIYVGKNNYQNEELTFKVASGNDWWFHAKGIPGSHVIVKSEGKELPDRVFEEAGALAAYYSKGRDSEKVEIDYIQKKSVKKVAGSAPGFVIYHTNYSLVAVPECRLQEIK